MNELTLVMAFNNQSDFRLKACISQVASTVAFLGKENCLLDRELIKLCFC